MLLDRRQFLLAGLAAPVFAQVPRAGPLFDRRFARVDKIAEGVYATIADPAKGDQAISNGGIIAGRNAVLIVEGHLRPAAAALEIEAARAISKAPILGAIDTHYHLDHTFGNRAYAEEQIPILGHERVAPLMKERYAALKGVNKAPLLAPLEQKIAKAADAADKQHYQSDLEATKWIFAGIDEATLAYPTETLGMKDLPKKIDLGGLTAVIEFHLGHTPTDLIIKVPERDVVFAGDLLFEHSYPVSGDANMMAWRGVLDLFAGYRRSTQFVPGHGPVCGLEVVREQQDLFDDLRAHAEKMRKAGASAEEATRRYVVPQRFRDFGIFAWSWTVGAAIESYFAGLGSRKAELSGAPSTGSRQEGRGILGSSNVGASAASWSTLRRQ